jgi:hypothetical protein
MASSPLGPRGFIKFLHPGYIGVDNMLIKLPRVDLKESQYGVHHGTALLACQIIAGNAFTGYLENEHRQRVREGPDATLVDRIYYFVIDGQGRFSCLSSSPYLRCRIS